MAVSISAFLSCTNSQAPCEPVKQELIPTEVAVAPMDPGQKSFGSGASRDTTGMAERRRRMMAEQNVIRTVHFNDLSMSDPYIYPDPVTKTQPVQDRVVLRDGKHQFRCRDRLYVIQLRIGRDVAVECKVDLTFQQRTRQLPGVSFRQMYGDIRVLPMKIRENVLKHPLTAV